MIHASSLISSYNHQRYFLSIIVFALDIMNHVFAFLSDFVFAFPQYFHALNVLVPSSFFNGKNLYALVHSLEMKNVGSSWGDRYFLWEKLVPFRCIQIFLDQVLGSRMDWPPRVIPMEFSCFGTWLRRLRGYRQGPWRLWRRGVEKQGEWCFGPLKITDDFLVKLIKSYIFPADLEMQIPTPKEKLWTPQPG